MNQNKAFTLVELAVAAVIVGFLAIMTVPNVLTSMNRSYSQDAMHNLMAIYAAQQNFAQNNNGVYCTGTSTSVLNSGPCTNGGGIGPNGLGLNIVETGGIVYACGANSCTATRPPSTAPNGFIMTVTRTTPVILSPVAVYCNVNNDFNPCCNGTSGVGTNPPCP